ncbi:MAG: 2OG-Fe(II) oxygenase [Myxococcota bacterium]
MLKPYDRDALRTQYQNAEPFPHIAIESFLEDEAARRVAAAYPTFDDARGDGREFRAVNEFKKVQICDTEKFPEPVLQLHEILASPAFLKDIEYITGIEGLLADPTLAGGGMHITGPRGRLDVHVDFNFLEELKLFRRLNILLYLNEEWPRSWGGAVELWDEKVERCYHRFQPTLNRCVLFETSERSYHGVEEVTCPPGTARRSFAAYYYTKEPPASYAGYDHTTIFRARPDEPLKRYVLMPAEKAMGAVKAGRQRARGGVAKVAKRLFGRD